MRARNHHDVGPAVSRVQRAIAFAFLLLALSMSPGCSDRTVYEALRQREIAQCNAMPEGSRQDCLDRTRDGYDDYQRKRSEAASGGR